jgi:hypothetical protein
LATAAAAAIADVEAGHQVQLNSRSAATAREKRERATTLGAARNKQVFSTWNNTSLTFRATLNSSQSPCKQEKIAQKIVCVCVGVCEFSLSLSFFLSGSLSLSIVSLSFFLSVWCSFCLSLSCLLCLLAVSLF